MTFEISSGAGGDERNAGLFVVIELLCLEHFHTYVHELLNFIMAAFYFT